MAPGCSPPCRGWRPDREMRSPRPPMSRRCPVRARIPSRGRTRLRLRETGCGLHWRGTSRHRSPGRARPRPLPARRASPCLRQSARHVVGHEAGISVQRPWPVRIGRNSGACAPRRDERDRDARMRLRETTGDGMPTYPRRHTSSPRHIRCLLHLTDWKAATRWRAARSRSTESPQVKMSTAAYLISGQMWIARCDSLITTTPDIPHGENLWKTTSTIVAPAMRAASVIVARTQSRSSRRSLAHS